MNVLTAYRSLGAEQKQILRDKKVDLSRPIDEILALLRPLAACDKVADKSRTKMGCSFGIGIVLSIVLLIVLSNVGWSAVTLLVLAVFVAVVIGLGVLYFFTRRIDLSNNFRSFSLPVLSLMREDFDASKPVNLRMNLDPPTASSKKTAESAPYNKGVYHKIIDTTYVDPWMTVSAVLVDGTKLSWNVTDEIRERKKTKKNPRGKYKTKTKYRKKTDIEVEMALLKKAYSMTPSTDSALTSDAKRHKVSLERKVRSESLDPLDPRVLIDVVANVYRNTRKPVKEAGA
jgi:hypothetical protein